jgi:outer membrane protein assembly factor BamB
LNKRHIFFSLAFLLFVAFTSRVAFGLYETTHPWTSYRHAQLRSGYQPVSTPDTNSTLWSWTSPSGVPKNPVIDEGIVYVAAYDDLYAIDETTGAQLWTVDVNGGSSSSNIGNRGPTVSDGKLYVGDVEGYLWCLNATNGQEIWHWLPRTALYR